MKTLTAFITITEATFTKANGLMTVDFNDESEEMKNLIRKLDARSNSLYLTADFSFENGAHVYINITSGNHCYYDSNLLVRPDGTHLNFDSAYSLDEVSEFYDEQNDINYICKFNILEGGDFEIMEERTTVNVGFITEDGREDETQLDIIDDVDLINLILDLRKEMEIKEILYVEKV